MKIGTDIWNIPIGEIPMPTIEIADTDFQRLQKIAVPLVDTPRSVITKLLDMHDAGSAPKLTRSISSDVEEFGTDSIPPLTHTKLMDAQFNNLAPEKMNWDALVRLALTQVFEHSKTLKELHRLSGSNVVEGEKHDEGYKFLSSHGFSYQGVSAEDAAKIIVRCAGALNCHVFFEFEWRNKEGAFRAGKRGIVRN